MKGNDLKLLEQLFRLNQKQLKTVITGFLKAHYDEVIEHDKFVCAKGTIPIALVAHLDTVFRTLPKEIYYDQKNKVLWSPDGLGADDRAGVFAIIKIIKSGLRPHIIFTTDEEKGALGAEALVKNGNPFKGNLNYIIQLDRRGINDCVFYQCENLNFIEYIESFGFKEAFGTFTDISIICPNWEIAGVNLSIGYENEHSIAEYLNINVMYDTISKVKDLLNEKSIPKFKYVKGSAPKNNYDFGFYFWCDVCNKVFLEEELFKVNKKNGTTVYMCPDCIVERAKWCDKCNSPYDSESDKCPKCEKESEKSVE